MADCVQILLAGGPGTFGLPASRLQGDASFGIPQDNQPEVPRSQGSQDTELPSCSPGTAVNPIITLKGP